MLMISVIRVTFFLLKEKSELFIPKISGKLKSCSSKEPNESSQNSVNMQLNI